MNWDDYRYLGVLASAGSVRKAAHLLGVNASTVTRRIEHLEDRLGLKLFYRLPRGMKVTPQGEAVLSRIDQVGAELGAVEATLRGADQKLTGSVSVSLSEILHSDGLFRVLSRFQQLYPDISMVLMPRGQEVNLDSGEVDVDLRVTAKPPEHLVGRPLGRVALGVYGTSAPDGSAPVAAAARSTVWIGWDENSELGHEDPLIRTRYFPDAAVRVMVQTQAMLAAALRAGQGIGILPRGVGDADPRLQRVADIPIQQSTPVWLLTHPDMRGARRIQTFTQHVTEAFNREPQVLLGEEQ